jgi:aspartyl-tRNA(Asn)/glutamyl-tRNA(Gln) amidotransferase subunit A
VTELARLSVLELRRGYAAGDFSPVDVVDSLAARIEALEPVLNAFTTATLDAAREEARAAERAFRVRLGDLRRPRPGPQRDRRPALRDAGAVLVGKTSLHEFAWGITNDNPHFTSDRLATHGSNASPAARAAAPATRRGS